MDDHRPNRPATLEIGIRRFGRLMIGAVAVIVLYTVMSVYFADERERRIQSDVTAIGGAFYSRYCGPMWIPESLSSRFHLYSRLHTIRLTGLQVSAGIYPELQSLTHLRELHLGRTATKDADLPYIEHLTSLRTLSLEYTSISDDGLKHLRELTYLQTIYLFNTSISDLGLETLASLPRLSYVDLRDTNTTSEGQARLQNALPNCKIVSNR